MNIDLDKTLGYETSHREGIFALHKTLAAATGGNVGEKIANDLTVMLSQAINAVLKEPMKPGATMAMAQLAGYLDALSALVGKLAEGRRFEVTKDYLGDTAVTVKNLSTKEYSK